MTYSVNDTDVQPAADHEEPGSADYVEVALDASCAALMALDLVRTFAADDERVTGRITLAIAALRHAIADLREQRTNGGRRAPVGFVCAGRLDDAPREGDVGRPARFRALP